MAEKIEFDLDHAYAYNHDTGELTVVGRREGTDYKFSLDRKVLLRTACRDLSAHEAEILATAEGFHAQICNTAFRVAAIDGFAQQAYILTAEDIEKYGGPISRPE